LPKISPKNFAKKSPNIFALFAQTTVSFWKNFRPKLAKIAENCEHMIDRQVWINSIFSLPKAT
jgi:hypothetical protein